MLRAFLGLSDIKPTNHRLVFERQADGRLRPQYRFQDPGSSIGTTVVVQRPRDLLRFPVTKNKIEEYDRDYVRAHKNGDVTITYNDGFFHQRDDLTATYADYKWMARVIGCLPDAVIKAAIEHAGIPEDLQSVYFYHIGNMKNRALKAFDLPDAQDADCAPHGPHLSDIGRLEDIDEPGVVEKGRVTATHVPGRLMLPKLQQTWFTFVNGLGGLVQQDFSKTIEKKFDLEYQGLVNSVVKKNTRLQASVLKDKVPQKVAAFSLTPGVSVLVQRVVTPNGTHFNAEGRGRPYVVKDLVTVEIGVEASIFKQLATFVTPDAGAKLKCFSCHFEHQHFSETVLGGYQSTIGVHRAMLGNLDWFALAVLEPGEVIKQHWSVGVDARVAGFAEVKTPGAALLATRGGATAALSWLRAGELTYAKDTLGSLHLIQEDIRQRGFDILLDVANIDAKQLSGALCKQRATSVNLQQRFIDIEVVPPVYDQENGMGAYTAYDMRHTAEWLTKIRHHPELLTERMAQKALPMSEEIPEYIQLHYQVDAKRVAFSRGHQFLYAFDHSRSHNKVDFNTVSRNHAYRFHKITRAKKGLVGIEELAIDFQMHNLLLKNGTSKQLSLEMDRDNPKKFVAILDIYDYRRTLTRQQLIDFIHALNVRYAQSPDKPFFRTDLLPSNEDYKKIYANGRVYIDGQALLERLDSLSLAAFTSAIRTAYQTRRTERSESVLTRGAHWVDDRKIARTALRLGRALKKKADAFAHHYARRDTAFDDGRDREQMENALASAVFDFIYTLYKSKHGLPLVQAVLGKESILVMGEIYGIHQQTGMLHDDMWKSTLRFMGASYGEGMRHTRAPVQQYVRHEQFLPPSDLAQPRIGIEQFLGPIPKGLSGEHVGLGQR